MNCLVRTLSSALPPRVKNNSLNFIRLLRVVITPSVTSLLRGENDSKQSDEFQASKINDYQRCKVDFLMA